MIKLLLILSVLWSTITVAGLPPSSIKGYGDTVFKGFSKLDLSKIPLSYSGSTATISSQFPLLTTTQKLAITSPAAGLTVYDTTLSALSVYNGAGWVTNSVATGTPVVPGTSAGTNIDVFSFSYGTTNSTTVCSASPCSYLDQIGTAVSSVTRASQGSYAAVFARTYSKVKCSASSMVNGVVEGTESTGASILSCASCSSLPFTTNRRDTGGSADTTGTFFCQGSY